MPMNYKLATSLSTVLSVVMAGSGASFEDNMHTLLIYQPNYRMDLYCWNENRVINRAREEAWTLHCQQVMAYTRDPLLDYEFGMCLEIDLETFDCMELSFDKNNVDYFKLEDKWTTNLRVRDNLPYALDGQQDWNAFNGGLSQYCKRVNNVETNECTLTMDFQRNFLTEDAYDLQLDTSKFGATAVIATITTINASGVRQRQTSPMMAATLMSFPQFDEVAIPEEILETLTDEENWPQEKTKYDYESKEWWQGRWEIYLVIIAGFLAFWVFQKYRKTQLKDALDNHKREAEEEEKRRLGE